MANKTLKTQVLIGGSITSSLRSAFRTTKDSLSQIGQAIANVDRRQRLLGSSIQTFGRMGSNVDGLRRQYDQLTAASDRLRLAQTRLATANRAVEANMSRRQAIGGQLMGAAGAAIGTGLAIGRPVMNAANFARENQLIGNTANMTRGEVKALGDTILAESKVTNQGADELQRAIGFLVAAGASASEAQASIRAIGRTTTAAGADIEDLAKAAFTLTDALKIKPEGLQGALDMLAVAGKEGNVELKDMAKVLPVLGASFQSLKMNGTEAVATLGAALEVARKGASSADEAANNMQNFMQKVLSPETLKKAEKNFGLDLYSVIQKAQKTGANPFEKAMEEIMKAVGDDQKKLGELFQDAQVQEFLKPMMQNWDKYKDIKNKALNESAGTTDRDFALMMETQAEQMKAARISADRLAKTFGMHLLPTVGDLSTKVGALLDKTTAFVKANPALVVGATKLATGLVGLRLAALAGGYAFTFLAAPVLKLSALVARFRAAQAVGELGKIGATATRIAGAARWAGLAVAGLGAGPVIGAVAALAAAGIFVARNWEPIKAFFTGFWQSFTSEAQPAIGALMGAITPLKPIWDSVVEVLGQAFDWFMKLVDPANASAEEIGRAAQAGRLLGLLLANGIKTSIAFIGMAVNSVQALGTILGTTAGAIVTTWSSAWEQVKTVVGKAVDWIAGKIAPITGAIGWITDQAGKVGATFTGMVGTAANKAEAALTTPTAAGRVPPALPAAAGRGAGAQPVKQEFNYNITQQPGESGEALAKRITEMQRNQRGVEQRGRLTD